MATDAPPNVLRRGRPGDYHFIAKCWMMDMAGHLEDLERKSGYWNGQRHVIATCIQDAARHDGIWVSAAPDDQSHILGFIVAEPRPAMGRHGILVVHFVYVRKFARKCGIAKSLLAQVQGGCKQIVSTYPLKGWQKKMSKRRRWGSAERWPYYRALAS